MIYEPYLGVDILVSHRLIEQISAVLPYFLLIGLTFLIVTFALMIPLPDRFTSSNKKD